MTTRADPAASRSLRDRLAMMGLRSKLLVGFGGLLAVLITVSVLANVVLARYSRSNQRMLREDLSSVQAVQDMRDALVGIETDVRGWLRGARPSAAESVRQHAGEFDAALALQFTTATIPQEPEATRRLADLWSDYRARVFALMGGAADEERRRQYEEDVAPLALGLREASQSISRLNIDNIRDAEAHADAIARAARLTIHALTAFGVAVAVGFALLIGRIILRPIRALTGSVHEVERGNLDSAVPVRSRDELGDLAAAFNAMAAQLREFRRVDHERLVRTQQTTQLAIDSLPDAVIVINPAGGIELANHTARRLFDLRPGTHVDETTKLPDGVLARLRRPAPPQQPYSHPSDAGGYADAIKARDGGADRYFLPRVVPIPDEQGRPIGLTVVLADVTDFRRLDEMKNGMLALVSHELKTPLTSMRIILPLLVAGRLGPLTPKQHELVTAARDDADRLHQIVENLLDMGRLESGRGLIDVRPVAAGDLVERSVEAYRAAFRDRGVALNVAIDDDGNAAATGDAAVVPSDPSSALVIADATRVKHVFANLLANALRYTPAGGAVRVGLRDAGDDRVEFSVADTGAGIPRQHLHRVFEKFFRAPGQPGDSGSGLGLAIVKDVVEAHGGHVGVESAEGHGTTFRFTLRRAAGQPVAVSVPLVQAVA